MQGEFIWHKHDDQDEFFFLLDGLFRIELENAERSSCGRARPSRCQRGCCTGPSCRFAARC
jgi:hypothetical protein